MSDRPPHLATLVDLLEGTAGLVAVYLFGSAARGGTVPPRDLDLAIVFPEREAHPLRRSLALQRVLEEAGLAVDVHDFGALPLQVQSRVLRDGILVVEYDPAERVRREVRAMLEYADFAPYLARIRQATLDRLSRSAPA